MRNAFKVRTILNTHTQFINLFTRACHRSLSWQRTIQTIPPHPISPRSRTACNIISHLFILFFRLCKLKSYMLLSRHANYMPCPSHLRSHDHYNYNWRRVHVMKLIIQFSPTWRKSYFSLGLSGWKILPIYEIQYGNMETNDKILIIHT
jgi:hypothetical protein